MPELPEVETTINGIKPYLIGHKIIDVKIRKSHLRFPIPQSINQKLIGHTVSTITRRAKYILFGIHHGVLIIHLGMSGSLKILLSPKTPELHDHVDVLFENQICLRFRDPRRFGAILWSDDERALKEHPLLKHLGIEPLSKTLTAKYLYQRAMNRQVAVKSFIMDSKIVVGVGNIYAAESLFAAGISPFKPASALSIPEWQSLVREIKSILKAAIKAGGTTLKDFIAPSGTPGYFSINLNVYGKEGQPCPQCKTKLKSRRINQRSTVYCEKCQK